jgi:hypothetical protein
MDADGGAGDGPRPREHDALEALRWDWGEAYLIGHDDEHGWYAGRRDKIGDLLTEAGPDDLRQAIADDYAVKRVGREAAEELTIP